MVLRNLDLQPAIFPFVVERIRDIDPAIRKFVYAKVMPEVGSFRKFSPEDRERILSWGLSDRDTSVQQACEQMINNNWIRECNENIIEVSNSYLCVWQ
jgi:condensin complex subunit 3